MKFSAFVLPGSPVDRNWRGMNRMGGTLDGVVFRYPEGTALTNRQGRYFAENVDPLVFAGNRSVVLEAIGTPTPQEEPTAPSGTADLDEDSDPGIEEDDGGGTSEEGGAPKEVRPALSLKKRRQ